MRDTYAILALRRKRAYLAGEIAQVERQLADKRKTLATLDATIQLFAPASNPELIPAIRPTRRGLFFRQGEQMRLCLAALREAGQPMSARQVAEYAMRAKGLPTDNAPILASITVQVRVALGRLEDKGTVVRIISAPDAWSALGGMLVKTLDADTTLSPLELRLEISKCLSNASFDFLERLYDRRSVAERYVEGDVDLHFHDSTNGMCCLARIASNKAGEAWVPRRPDMDSAVALVSDNFSVLVGIGNLAERLCPTDSIVRLQPLNLCDMSGADAFEPGCIALSNKFLMAVHNRKLCSVLFNSGIPLCKLKYEVIEGAPQIVTNLPDDDAQVRAVEIFHRECSNPVMGRGLIKVDGDGVSLLLSNFSKGAFELSKMFACPVYSCEAVIQRLEYIRRHTIRSLAGVATPG